MDSAMLPSRISRSVSVRLGVCGSERTAVPGTCLATVALLLGARQRGSELGGRRSEVPWKVGLESRLPRLGADREQSQRVSLVASGRSSTVVDCSQCSATAAGRWGGVLVRRAWDAGGHMGPSDLS